MEYDERDHEVVRLLSRLKETGSSYPVALLASRRQRFVKQIAALGFGAAAALAVKETARAAGGASIPSVASTILETALIVAIVAEAGYVAVVHRERILDWFRTISTESAVEAISTSPASDLPPVEMPVTGPTLPTLVIETIARTTAATVTPTLAVTPSPPLPLLTVTVDVRNNSDEVPANSTPEPQDDNGNHYGQTPRAERTHESGGGGGSDPGKDDPKPVDDNETDNGNEDETKDPKK